MSTYAPNPNWQVPRSEILSAHGMLLCIMNTSMAHDPAAADAYPTAIKLDIIRLIMPQKREPTAPPQAIVTYIFDPGFAILSVVGRSDSGGPLAR
mmetsp:Transcript_10301/g.22890  ORF Transcript_10301/g.22890 Transcript_10301/m.22890 type:complete len:95 (+) Transcript_10301:662-946(+)